MEVVQVNVCTWNADYHTSNNRPWAFMILFCSVVVNLPAPTDRACYAHTL